MHRASHYLAGRFPPNAKKALVESYVLTPHDAATVKAALGVDADDYYYSACMSLVDGLRAIDAGFYTWSTVKLYYSIFYSLRALLAWNDIAVFRPHEAPFSAVAAAGSLPQFVEGKGSHKSMLNCFRKRMPSHFLLSQDIELIDGPAWMMEKRESANYAIPRFCEPSVPEHYVRVAQLGIRKAVAAYFGSQGDVLAFDKDHAIVAFPLAALRAAGSVAKGRGGAITSLDEMAFLRLKCRERGGSLSPLLTFFSSTVKA